MKLLSRLDARISGIALALVLSPTVSAQDFALTLQPRTLTLIPTEQSSLLLSLTPLNGFTSQVSLAVGTLPAGVTAQFSPQTLALPGTSLLTLSAATNASLGGFTLNVIATGGGITNTTSSSVTVNFGLLPICTGTISGAVTDAQTGLPVTNATVTSLYTGNYASADTNGQYTMTNLSLGNNNSPYPYDLAANAAGYWQSAPATGYAVCDATNTVDLRVIRQEYGSVSGTVTIQGGGPAAGVQVLIGGSVLGGTNTTLTDTNGFYQFTGVGLNYTNAPILQDVSCSVPLLYWFTISNAVVQANSNTVINLVLVPICHGAITGSVFYADTKLPAPHVAVNTEGGFGQIPTSTDSNGNYSVTNITLPENRAVLNGGVEAYASGYTPGSVQAAITNCGDTVTAPSIYLNPIPKVSYGAVNCHVFDIQTGLPIPQAHLILEYISPYIYAGATDTNGAFLSTNMAAALYYVSASASGYFQASTNVTVTVNLTNSLDVFLLKIGYGAVVGTVRDSATGLPLTNVEVGISGQYVYTDANGHYYSGPLALSYPNVPTQYSIGTGPQGYYGDYTTTMITLGVTNVVDLNPIKICTGATIAGTVVNALTQQPITNATLNAGSARPAFTDTNGNFVLTNVTVGNLNSPIEVDVFASAPGFISQSKTVTIFCNANITMEFGAPQTAFAIVQGVVTNAVTGLPLAGVFIGSQFGESTYTDTNGSYQLTQAPLGANNSSRTWNITAMPTNFPAQTLPVTVSSNSISTLDFGFGSPPTALIVTATGAPNPVTVGSNLLYLVTLTNTVANAQQVQLSDTLPPGVTVVSAALTNSPGTPFSAPTYSNNIVMTTASDFGSNSAVILAILVTPTVAGTLTNVATVSSATADIDPTDSNHVATVITPVVSIPRTALMVSASGTPNPDTVGSNLLYLVTLTNTLTDARQVQLSDTLPPGVTFVSAALTNSPGTPFSAPIYSDNIVTTTASDFGSNSTVTVAILVTPTLTGMLTNVATVNSATPDIDPTGSNHTATVVTTISPPTQADLALALAQDAASIVLGSNVTYTLSVTNLGPASAPDVVLNDTLPSGAAYVSSTSSQGAVTPNGGSVHWDFGALASQGIASATLAITPSSAGLITNRATASLVAGGSAVFDPNLANNTASVVAMVTVPITNVPPTALVLTAFGAPSPVTVGSNLFYFVNLANNLADAKSVQLSDTLPPGVTFISAAITNSAGTMFTTPVYSNHVVTTDSSDFGSNSSALLTIEVAATLAGTLTNLAIVSSVTPDIDPTGSNHTATVLTAVNPPPPILTNAPVQVLGPISFNPQTGLYQQSILFTNLSGVADTAVRVAVLDLPSGVVLYNATGFTNGAPYVEYDQTLPPGSGVVFLLEYYEAARQPFVSTNFLATIVAAQPPPAPNGTILKLDANGVFISQGLLTIEFASIPGKTYAVQYSTDAASTQWLTAVPSILATNTVTQWIDSGPPKTLSPPGAPGQRFYRVVQTN